MSASRISLLVVACLMLPQGADATTVRTGKPAASQPPARAWATRDQLRECMDIEAGLKARFKAIEATNASHEKMFDEVEAENTKLRDLQAQLDRDSDTSISTGMAGS